MKNRFSTLAISLGLVAGSLTPVLLVSSPAAAANPVCSPTATVSGGYTYLAFKSVSNCDWNVPAGVTSIDYLVVGGGGGGATRHAGGGGAGGLLQGTASVASVTSLTMSVGAGGAGGIAVIDNYAQGTSGSSSSITLASGSGSFTTVTAVGGGGGSTTAAVNGLSGGSGGGALATGGAGTVGQGSNGGNGITNSATYWLSGGGGGAGGVGTNATSSTAGTGGAGATWTGSGFSTNIAAALGLANTSNTYFAGGGGGGGTTGTTPGSGGIGGGGNGSTSSADGGSGVANTGSGGGGGGIAATMPKGGNGGSGVILIRVIIASPITEKYGFDNVADVQRVPDFPVCGADFTASSPTKQISSPAYDNWVYLDSVVTGGAYLQLYPTGNPLYPWGLAMYPNSVTTPTLSNDLRSNGSAWVDNTDPNYSAYPHFNPYGGNVYGLYSGGFLYVSFFNRGLFMSIGSTLTGSRTYQPDPTTNDCSGASAVATPAGMFGTPATLAAAPFVTTDKFFYDQYPSYGETVTNQVVVTNSGNANLVFRACVGASCPVSISGTNAADFSITSDSCSGNTLLPTGTCQVDYSFTASSVTAKSAFMNFADNAVNSPQTVALRIPQVNPNFSSLSGISPASNQYLVGTQLTLAVTVSPASCPISGVYAPTYSLDTNPVDGTSGPYDLGSSPVSTSNWRVGTYYLTVSYPGDGSYCYGQSDQTILTIVSNDLPTGAAFGGGYFNSVSGRSNFGFVVSPDAKTRQYRGQLLWTQKNSWKFKGVLNSYVANSTTKISTASGTGLLYFWRKSGSGGNWVLATSGAANVTINFTGNVPATKKSSGSTGSFGIGFTGTQANGSPALPVMPDTLAPLSNGSITLK